MAASCRRLAKFGSRSWAITAKRLHHAATVSGIQSTANVLGLGVCRVAAPLCHRQLCTKTVEAPPTATPASGGGIFSRFWVWLNDDSGGELVIGEEEKQEREELLHRMQDMYFAKPPVAPDIDFYKEVFTILVKHNDRIGVETLWNFMREMNVEPDSELTRLVEPYLEKARRNVWFE